MGDLRPCQWTSCWSKWRSQVSALTLGEHFLWSSPALYKISCASFSKPAVLKVEHVSQSLGGHVKPISKVGESVVLDRAQDSAFLTSSQVMLMLLLPDPCELWEPQCKSLPKSSFVSSLSNCLLSAQRLWRYKMLPKCKALCFLELYLNKTNFISWVNTIYTQL